MIARKTIVLMMTLVLSLAIGYGQSAQPEQELTAFKPDAILGSTEKRCGEYFILNPGHYDGQAYGPGINWQAVRTVNGTPTALVGLFLKNKLTTVIDETKKRPTVQYLIGAGNVVQKITIRISTTDYDKAKDCLPLP